ncbi:spermatogenesis-associated protein 1 [Oryzias melastigma]|uniref:spermatogenesis-associated protein 1 n=1 Tax=Oryzias melastigma TaxID=30732 RepID=UPI000CF80B4E|nr:spermatogenesis-associated protein 1 [Oryzias melastigma]
MELFCESMKHTEDNRRPTSCKFVELHVLCVPGDQWNVKLNKVPAETSESFISAGFIRVYPDLTLKRLRTELDAHLGAERSTNKYSFLKCVGRSLALVYRNQEKELRVKLFAPPYAAQPELYLLPAIEADSSFCSQSFSPDTSSSSMEEQNLFLSPKICSPPTETKNLLKFHQCPLQPLPRFEELEEEDDKSCSSSERENEEEALSFIRKAEEESYSQKHPNQRELQLDSLKEALERCEVGSSQKKFPADREEICVKKKKQHKGEGQSGEAPEWRDSSLTDRVGKSKDSHRLTSVEHKLTSEESQKSSGSTSCNKETPTCCPVLHTDREALIEEIKLVREKRKQLEWTKQELLRKGKDLLAQSSHRRNQARNCWKKKYFETKKATGPLEDKLKDLRQEMETFYNKLLLQLQARESRGKIRRQGRSSEKNELTVLIMKETYEIDKLKRKVEDAQMKLVAEIKLRKQAAAELKALKAELLQKKSQLKGDPAWTGLHVQSSSSDV